VVKDYDWDDFTDLHSEGESYGRLIAPNLLSLHAAGLSMIADSISYEATKITSFEDARSVGPNRLVTLLSQFLVSLSVDCLS